MSEPEGASLEGKTIAQPEALQQVSREQSVPKGVVQHPEAPKIAGYVLTRPLGRGAFAEVWRAWQVRTRKTVAIKVFVKSSGVDWLYLQREVERLIRLDKHPHIVSLLDADLQGEPPYYAMDLMEGGSLERYVGLQERPPAGAVERWAEEIADALAFVHAKGLLHCDLKPANVMLDEQGHVRVADFGQSRILTDSAGALGTFFFMAPEQAVLNEDVGELHPDVRWDVFAVGTTLYGVLAGRLPFAEERAKLEAAKSLKDRLAAYRKLVASSPLRWDGPPAPGEEDLRAIIEKCAAPSPEARYQAVAEVRADLEAMRRLLPVSPLASSRVYRVRRFVQRNLALVALGAAAAVGLVFTGVQLYQARGDAERRLAFSYAMRGRHFSELGDDAGAAAYYAEAYRLDQSPLARAAALAHLSQLQLPLRVYPHKWGVRAAALSPDGKRLVTGSWDKGANLWDADGPESERKRLAHDASVTAAGFDKGGAKVVTADQDGRVKVWDAGSGELKAEFVGHAGEVTLARLSPDGKRVLTAGTDRSLRLWSAEDGKPAGPALAEGADVAAAAFSPDGSVIASAETDGTLRVWRTDGAAAAVATSTGGLAALAFSARGSRLATLGADGSVRVWDAAAAPLSPTSVPVSAAVAAAFDGDGRVVTAGADGGLRVWDPARASQAARSLSAGLAGGPAIRALAVVETGVIAVGDEDGLVRFWSAATGQPLGGALKHAGAVDAIAAAGPRLLTVAADGAVRLWTAPEAPSAQPGAGEGEPVGTAAGTPAGLRVLRHGAGLAAIAFSEDGRLWTAGGGAGFRAWSLPSGERSGEWAEPSAPAARAAFSPDGKRALAAAADGSLRLFDAKTGESVALHHKAEVLSAAFSPDGGRAATGDRAGLVHLWDTASEGAPRATLPLGAPAGAVALNPGAGLVAAGSADGALVLAEGEKVLVRLEGPTDWIVSAAFSSDGRRIIAGSWDGAARVWDVRTCLAASSRAAALEDRGFQETAGCEALAAYRHTADVAAVAFDATGRLAASADWGGGAAVWDADTGRPLGPMLRHGGAVASIAFSPDGGLVLTGSADGTARLWDAGSGEPVWRPIHAGAPVTQVGFSRDGRYAAAAASDGAARVWPIAFDEKLDRRRLGLRVALGGLKRVNDQGDLETVPAEELPALREKLAALEGR